VQWSEIAVRLGTGRIGKQVRERWNNRLDPSLKKGPWTAEEDELMFAEQARRGNMWKEISTVIRYIAGSDVTTTWCPCFITHRALCPLVDVYVTAAVARKTT
jgi:hypothetical protein